MAPLNYYYSPLLELSFCRMIWGGGWWQTFVISGLDDLGSEKSPGSSIGGGSMSNREMVVSSSSMTSSSAETPSGSGLHGGHQQRKSRAGRVRTVLTEKQLSLLKSCYNANPRPDALMKEQMVEMTGLSPRVIRVWFQNKRCKDKKKHILQKSKVIVSVLYHCSSITNPDYRVPLGR